MPRICLADLHLNTKKDKEFEYSRIEALVSLLISSYPPTHSISLLGDILDSNNLRPDDIKLFYWFMDSLTNYFNDVVIIDGNHDSVILQYLPKINFQYISTPTLLGNLLYVPWSSIKEFTPALSLQASRNDIILMTHARCTIAPFIKEEVDIKLLSTKFSKVILGDIHIPYEPYKNVYYTSEPMQHSYKKHDKGSTGFIVLEDDNSITRVTTDLPRREKLAINSLDNLEKLLLKLDTRNRYKISIIDTLPNLQKAKNLKYPHISFELIPRVETKTTDHEDIKALANKKVSVEEMLFDYIQEAYKFPIEIPSKIQGRLRLLK